MRSKKRLESGSNSPTDSEEEGAENSLSNQLLGQIGLSSFIITTFFPQIAKWLAQHPKLVRRLSIPIAIWFGYEFLMGKVSAAWYKLMSNCMSSVDITPDDTALHSSFTTFLTKKNLVMSQRYMSATSTQFLRNGVSNGRLYEKQLTNGQNIFFDPKNKFQFFWDTGRLYCLTVDKSLRPGPLSHITIWTFGFTPKPIVKMLSQAYEDSTREDGKILTQIYVPYHGRQWQQRSAKARRPLSSVYLAEGQKQKLLADVTDYLDPKSTKWHEERSIPHRRGYLFHGPPGTGKTTLAMAIAGQFKLQVYMLSLLDEHIDDGTLLTLFQSIRAGTLLLLEDVDCAGIGRRPKVSSRKVKPTYDSEGNELKEERSRVTLSGLLNAIDGAGAPEGHILVMTTNDPDSLDAALVRAGRVDTWVPFNNATKSQIRDIFINMYIPVSENADSSHYASTGDSVPSLDGSASTSSSNGHMNGHANGHTNGVTPITNGHIILTDKERLEQKSLAYAKDVYRLAGRFMDKIPEGKFSPAQLQGYIMFYKDKPEEAVEDVGGWVDEKLAEQERKGEVEKADGNA